MFGNAFETMKKNPVIPLITRLFENNLEFHQSFIQAYSKKTTDTAQGFLSKLFQRRKYFSESSSRKSLVKSSSDLLYQECVFCIKSVYFEARKF